MIDDYGAVIIFKLVICKTPFGNILKNHITFRMGPFCKNSKTSHFPKCWMLKDGTFAVLRKEGHMRGSNIG